MAEAELIDVLILGLFYYSFFSNTVTKNDFHNVTNLFWYIVRVNGSFTFRSSKFIIINDCI